MARYAIDRGLSHRRSAWLCSTPRSGIHYHSKRERRDRHLSSALRIVARDDPGWGYRLAAGYLRLRGWRVNDKRVYRLWRLNGLCLPPYRPRRKIRSGANLKVWRCDATTYGRGILSMIVATTLNPYKDEATGYCLAIKTDRHLQHTHIKSHRH